LALREEHRLRVFEKRVLRRIFGPKRDEVTGGRRKLHNKELRDLYSLPSTRCFKKEFYNIESVHELTQRTHTMFRAVIT
jgi:hypothetical protein